MRRRSTSTTGAPAWCVLVAFSIASKKPLLDSRRHHSIRSFHYSPRSPCSPSAPPTRSRCCSTCWASRHPGTGLGTSVRAWEERGSWRWLDITLRKQADGLTDLTDWLAFPRHIHTRPRRVQDRARPRRGAPGHSSGQPPGGRLERDRADRGERGAGPLRHLGEPSRWYGLVICFALLFSTVDRGGQKAVSIDKPTLSTTTGHVVDDDTTQHTQRGSTARWTPTRGRPRSWRLGGPWAR
jgi:hypothetical protein